MEEDRTAHALRVLQLNEVRWQAILDTARDAIICIDRRGDVTLFNRAAEATFGYTADEVLGRNVRMLMPSPYQEEHDGYLVNYHATGTPQAIDQGPGCVAIGVSRIDERVRFTVSDDGPGIANNVEMFKLFETTKRNGSGLGLSISKQIVLAHGGNISFERLAPHGTAFHVELPARVASV